MYTKANSTRQYFLIKRTAELDDTASLFIILKLLYLSGSINRSYSLFDPPSAQAIPATSKLNMKRLNYHNIIIGN